MKKHTLQPAKCGETTANRNTVNKQPFHLDVWLNA